MSELRNEIRDFIVGQMANTESPAAAKLALCIREAVQACREAGEENRDALSIDARYEEGEFVDVRVAFTEDDSMTILYHEGTDAVVQAIWLGLPEADEELARLAGLMLSEGWIEGFPK